MERLIWWGFAIAMGGPLRYRLTMTMAKLGMRVIPWLPWHPGKLGAWTRGRALPEIPAGGSFRAWWKNRSVGEKKPS